VRARDRGEDGVPVGDVEGEREHRVAECVDEIGEGVGVAGCGRHGVPTPEGGPGPDAPEATRVPVMNQVLPVIGTFLGRRIGR
jgi:hypothetical protein